LLDEVVRDGARQMLAAGLQAEVAACVEAHANQVDKRTDEATGERRRFSSAILPAWSRTSPRVAEVSPLLYLHGLSTSDFAPALEQFLSSDAGLSAATITRLTTQWQDEAAAFNKRPLKDSDYVYVWVDGIHLEVRLEQDKVCPLVMIGVRADGTKELIALDDGHRESTESWADLLRSAKRRGMRAPVLAVGDGALGFWAAVREEFPATHEQRCWFHKIANVLNALPKSAPPRREGRARGDLERRGPGARRGRRPRVRCRLRGQVAQGGREDHRGPRRAARLLRLPRPSTGCTCAPPTRSSRRSRPSGCASGSPRDPARELPGRDGVQAHRGRPDQVASRERAPRRRPGPSRREVREGQTRRTTRRIRR